MALVPVPFVVDLTFSLSPPSDTLGVFDFNLHLTAPPASGLFIFPGEGAGISRYMKCVPEVCQSIAELGVLAGLVRRKNSKLRAVNGGRRTDSVPGHQVFKYLQT